jgi:hypothetical protein
MAAFSMFPLSGSQLFTTPLLINVRATRSVGGVSLHWPDLDEDLSIAGLMAGVDLQSA